jgi:hypothetical protein
MGHRLGLDLSCVRTSADFSAHLVGWVEAMTVLRFDVVEKLALELARLKGVRLPAHLVAVLPTDAPSSNSQSRLE